MKGDIRDSWIKESKFRNGLVPLWTFSPFLNFVRYSFRRTGEIGGGGGAHQKRSRVERQVRFPSWVQLMYRRSQPQLIPLIRVASSAGQAGRG